MALLIGISLGTSGGVMQTILHNPLASPYTLGIGAGASFGASISIICNLGDAWTMVLAFLFAMLISTFIYLIGRFTKLSTHTMTLTGIGMLFLFQAGQGFIQYMASENQNQEIVFWTFGSLQKADYFKVLILFGGVIICLPLIYLNSWKYNSLLLGEEKAESLGINTNRIRIESLLLISILSSLAVCFTGPIGFIGLAGPHIGKILVGEDHRYYLPLSALAGGFILILADILSKVISPGSIFPVGIITSLIGVPFFFVVLLKGRKRA